MFRSRIITFVHPLTPLNCLENHDSWGKFFRPITRRGKESEINSECRGKIIKLELNYTNTGEPERAKTNHRRTRSWLQAPSTLRGGATFILYQLLQGSNKNAIILLGEGCEHCVQSYVSSQHEKQLSIYLYIRGIGVREYLYTHVRLFVMLSHDPEMRTLIHKQQTDPHADTRGNKLTSQRDCSPCVIHRS